MKTAVRDPLILMRRWARTHTHTHAQTHTSRRAERGVLVSELMKQRSDGACTQGR